MIYKIQTKESPEPEIPVWFEKWREVSLELSPTSCRRTNPNIQCGSRVFCRYSSAYYPATVIDVEPSALRVIYDDVEMKQKKVLVKKVDTRLISELGRGMNVLARKKGESIYNTATIVASYQKTNLLDMTQREGQLECALTNGYVVIFQEETQDEYFIPNSDIAIDSQMFNDENSQPFNSYTVTATNGDLANIVDSPYRRKQRGPRAEKKILFTSSTSIEIMETCQKENVQIERDFQSSIWLDQKSQVECMVLFDNITEPTFMLGCLWNLPIVKCEKQKLVPYKPKVSKELWKHLNELKTVLDNNRNNDELAKFIARATQHKKGFRQFAKPKKGNLLTTFQ